MNNPDCWMVVVTSVNVLISGLLIYITYILGKKQNIIQQNNIRIQMHKEYYDIFEAIIKDKKEIDGVIEKFNNSLNGRGNSDMNKCHVRDILPRAKQLLPDDYYNILSMFVSNYTWIQRNTPNMLHYMSICKEETRIILSYKLEKEGLTAFLDELYDVLDYLDIDEYSSKINKIHTHITSEYLEKIRSYSDLSDIVTSK